MIQFIQTIIEGYLWIIALIAAAVIIYFIIKKFLYDGVFRSKKLSKYNEILYLKNRNETDKVSFAIRDYLGFDIPEEEINFALSNPRNAFMFFTHRKKAGKSKVKFENGKYTAEYHKVLPLIVFSIGVLLFSLYISFFSILSNSIEDKKNLILFSIYVLCISLPMMISSYISISENFSSAQLEEFSPANDEGEKNGTGKKS